MSTVRRLWSLYEPIHDVVYFAEEARAAAAAAGYKGYWMAYYALRAAPLGAVGPEAVAAVFYGFHPSRAHRALPDAWELAGPDRALATRLDGVDAALRRVWGSAAEADEVAEAADLAWTAAQHADPAGRVLGAANQALPRPDRPHLALWQAATTLREHRGDGHNAVLVASGLPPCHAHLLKIASGEADADLLRVSRNWPDDAWRQATDDLVRRGWLDRAERLTDAGVAARSDIERRTDDAAAGPWLALSAGQLDRLAELLTPLANAVTETGMVPLPNPVGVPPA